ncbi:hypothetical protein [Chryseobacterium sp. Leaf394]|uniref:hypothetical protein n=1 Tax=Chryseobacterium sp. Leaf394 TaxID=1736361 RepID=UPI0006F65FE4|nr:hypothetical protein [Chryseobacterium sp. Leaf394]KQS93033.1 hypothetical protein ASG21_11560 [Chryseobacterium sp. Leaf394]
MILLTAIHSCIKEIKTGHKNQTNAEIKKPVDSTKSVYVETSVNAHHYAIVVEKIDSLQYYYVKKKTALTKKKLLKITDFREAKRLLKGIVDFDENPDFGNHPAVKKIHFRNGKTYENIMILITVFLSLTFPMKIFYSLKEGIPQI